MYLLLQWRSIDILGALHKCFKHSLEKIDYFTVNDKWPIFGGSHYEVLDYLGFSQDKLKDRIKIYLF